MPGLRTQSLVQCVHCGRYCVKKERGTKNSLKRCPLIKKPQKDKPDPCFPEQRRLFSRSDREPGMTVVGHVTGQSKSNEALFL